MLSLLATGDGLTCISILLMGIEGKKKYEIELNSGLVPKEVHYIYLYRLRL
jgi:hypothetical protein